MSKCNQLFKYIRDLVISLLISLFCSQILSLTLNKQRCYKSQTGGVYIKTLFFVKLPFVSTDKLFPLVFNTFKFTNLRKMIIK